MARGLMRQRDGSINDLPIRARETRAHSANQPLCETLEDEVNGTFEDLFPFAAMRCKHVTHAAIVRIAFRAMAAQDCAVEMIGSVR
jgi:hypothetical protein